MKNWTVKGQQKPNILQDIISAKNALKELYRGMGKGFKGKEALLYG